LNLEFGILNLKSASDGAGERDRWVIPLSESMTRDSGKRATKSWVGRLHLFSPVFFALLLPLFAQLFEFPAKSFADLECSLSSADDYVLAHSADSLAK